MICSDIKAVLASAEPTAKHKLLKVQSSPDVDMECFDGNVLEYHYLMALFREVVESKIEDPRDRLTRLIKPTVGDAIDLIKQCIQLSFNEGFTHAKYLQRCVATQTGYWPPTERKYKTGRRLSLETQGI